MRARKSYAVVVIAAVLATGCGADEPDNGGAEVNAESAAAETAIVSSLGRVVEVDASDGSIIRQLLRMGDVDAAIGVPLDLAVDRERSILYVERAGDCASAIMSAPLVGGSDPLELVADDQVGTSTPRVSPDGSHLAYRLDTNVDDDACNDTDTIVVRDLENGAERRYALGAERIEWLGEQALLVERPNSSVPEVRRLDLDHAEGEIEFDSLPSVATGALLDAATHAGVTTIAVREPCSDPTISYCDAPLLIVDATNGGPQTRFRPPAGEWIATAELPDNGSVVEVMAGLQELDGDELPDTRQRRLVRARGDDVTVLLPDFSYVDW
jgi:hypothetical protein